MHYTTFFVTAIAAISSVSAMPAEAADRDRDRDRYDVFPRGECRDEGDDLYCGRGVNEFCRYGMNFTGIKVRVDANGTLDASNRYCRSDNVNRIFCAYRNQQEFARQLAEEWLSIEICDRDEYWDVRRRRCECYRGRDGDRDRDRECRRRRGESDRDRDGERDGRDGDRGGRDGNRDDDRNDGRDGDRGRERDAPNCKNGDIAFCAANENDIITFERENTLCLRDRGNYVFCASPERGRAREKARDHFNKKAA
nr:uncharacterized protein CTRU02_14816 [Colletotrichum truncatum]KAF6781824.1 hypothetical protein CTRU02_14816 [Colletotrichum truncatum]